MLLEYSRDLPFYIVSKGLTALSWLFVVWVLTKHLTPSQYGEYSLLYSLITLTAIVCTSWINSSIYRYLPEQIESNTEPIFLSIIFRLSFITVLIGLSFFSVVVLLSNTIGIMANSAAAIALACFAFALHSAFILITGYLSAKRSLKIYSYIIIGQLGIFAAGLYFLMHRFDDSNALIFFLLAASYCPAFLLSLLRLERVRLPIKAKALEYLRYGFPLIFLSSSTLINMYGDQFVIGYYGSSAEVGLYAANYVFAERSILTIANVMALAYLPILFRTWERGEEEAAYRFLWKIVYLLLCLMIPVQLLLFFYGQQLAGMVIDSRFESGSAIIPIVGVASIFNSLAGVMSDSMTLHKRTAIIAWCYAMAAILNIALNLIFVPVYGFIAAAYSTLTSCTFLLFIVCVSAHKNSRVFHYGFFKKKR